MSSSFDVFKDRVRYFNKWVLNQVTRTFAGRRHSPYSIVHHVGRKSGQAYATPVLAMSEEDDFVIPLPYGVDTDWCRNVLAADGCLIENDGRVYRAVGPEIVEPEVGLPAFPAWIQDLLSRSETEHFLCLQRSGEVASDDPAYQRVWATHEDDTKVLLILVAVVASLIALGIHLRRKEK